MELFQERGYASTTVEDIAARAGLTERTFFRYFADKREVLFAGSGWLEEMIVARIAEAPRDVGALDVVVLGVEAAAVALQTDHDLRMVRARFALVSKHAEIQERELSKMAALAAAMTTALRARGVPDPAASLAAESGIAIFKVGFERWLAAKSAGDFAAHVRAALKTLRAVASETKATKASKTTRRG